MDIKSIQQKQLFALLRKSSNTDIGRRFKFSEIDTYSEFAQSLPIQSYQDIEQDVERIKRGTPDILWPGRIDKFSVSAGTTSSGKHLPISSERLKADKRFIRMVAFSYFRQRLTGSPMLGKHLSIPGSLEQKKLGDREVQFGEISGFLGTLTPWFLKWHQVIQTNQLLSLPFSEKFDRLLDAAIEADIRVITAVPSWTLTLFQHVLEKTGHTTIDRVWPHLKLIISGGVKLAHYKSHLQSLCGTLNPDFIETYGASEGYFSFTDNLGSSDMKLVVDNGIFYEWIPYGEDTPHPTNGSPLPTWKVEKHTPYAMVVSNNSGLWRYRVGDVIEFTNLAPPHIKVKGRTQELLDTYGEAVHGWEAESALTACTQELNLSFDQFTLGSLLTDQHRVPRHYWFILFQNPEAIPASTIQKISRSLDLQLQSINRHYAIRRESDALGSPAIFKINFSNIQNWLEYNNRLQVQGKLPRILLDQEEIELMLDIVKANNSE